MQYWDMTYKEISTTIKAYSKRAESDMRISAIISYHQARLISHHVGIIVGSKETPKAIYEAFPGMFPHLEKEAAIKAAIENTKQQDWKLMKDRIDAYAAERRKRGAVEVGNDD